MSLGKYASACRDQISELKASLSREDLEELAADYGSMLSEPWLRWVQDHESDLSAFVSAAPGARGAKRVWQDPVVRKRLTLAAIFHVMQAEIVLNTLSEMDLTPGGSYRDMAVHAGEAYNRIVFDQEVPLWPFDNYLDVVVPKRS